ncbi:MAG TPA: BatA and WFA domain-containing protein [Planctomycetota bacterium]|nr:BatA and WFA domain-containing protein [Planctomycetota bacterium]
MSILHPLGLLALAAVPVLIALSLWRWRRREVVVSSLLLWRDVATAWRQAPHARRRRQADPLLVLRVAVAVVLAAALCGPVWLRPARVARRLVIVLDRSASMAARRPDGSTRWRACRDGLLKLLVRLDAADRVELVAVPPPVGRSVPPELDRQEAASLLLGLLPSEAPVTPQELARAATEAARGRPGASVVVATDAPLAGLPAGVSVLATGAPLRNLGITAFAARLTRDGRHEVLVTVANASAEPLAATVVLRANGREVARRRLDLAPAADQHVVFEARLGPAAVLDAYVAGPAGAPDDLEADDRAWLARSAPRVRVAWVGDDCYTLRRALAIQDGVELADLAEPPPEAVPRGFDLAVYYHAAPRALAGGSVVVVAPRAPVGGLRPGPLAEAGPASVVARTDPLLAAVQLEGVALGRVPRPELPAGFRTLVAAGGVPVIGRWREGGATLTYVGTDPAASDWPLDPSFPIFWANLVSGATGQGLEAGALASVRPGEAVPVRGDASLEEPGGERRPLASGVFRPERTGLYRLVSGNETRAIAVSLLSEAETLAAGSEAAPASDLLARREESAGLAGAWRLGGWLTLLALGLVVAHGWLAARTRA